MPSIRTAISIGQPIDRVFKFVTTISHCPRWCRSLWRGPSEHLHRVGEHATEEFSLDGRRADPMDRSRKQPAATLGH